MVVRANLQQEHSCRSVATGTFSLFQLFFVKRYFKKGKNILLQALGVEVDAHAQREAADALAAGQELLAGVTPAVLRTLAYESSAVCLSCMQYLNSFLARVKNTLKRQGGLDDAMQQQLLLVMQVCHA